MTYYEALDILRAIRRGQGAHFSRATIDQALRLSGDLDA